MNISLLSPLKIGVKSTSTWHCSAFRSHFSFHRNGLAPINAQDVHSALIFISRPCGYTNLRHFCRQETSSSTIKMLTSLDIADTKSKLTLMSGIGRSLRCFSTHASTGDFFEGKPSLKYVSSMRKSYASMSNEQILHFAHMQVPEACRECIIRDVMLVDQIEYDEAKKVFNEIAATNRKGMPLYGLPFRAGFIAAFVGGWASIPLVFDVETMIWFNHHYVTSELPPPADLETWLEVGATSWSWMEPVLGQVSFFLLCMQFARSQLQNLGIRPYFHWQQKRRADRLVAKYPQYHAPFLRAYSESDQLFAPHDFSD